MYRNHLKRSAFTLIELLVVIAIIAILSALVMGGVMAYLRKPAQVSTVNDISQLSIGLNNFYAQYKFYPPDKIKLYSKLASYNATVPLDQVSLSYIGAMWPNIDRTPTATFAWAGSAGFTEGTVLEGDQCLVFFLGGIPNGSGLPPQGFFNNPTNPTVAAGTSSDRVKFFDFDGARCVTLRAGNPFPSYLDSHAINNDGSTKKKQPYAYFSSGKRPDGYSSAYNSLLQVSPYVQQPAPSLKYYNSTKFQLISAGADGNFGPGSTVVGPPVTQIAWQPGNGPVASIDDVTNFP